MYSGLTAAVHWLSKISDWFPVNQAVRQGGVLSPLLYLVFLDDLIKALRRSGAGCEQLGRYVGTLVFADDVVLLADTPQDLNSMLQIVQSYTTQCHYSINPQKSAVVTFNSSIPAGLLTWHLGHDTIPEREGHPHLGVHRSSAPHDSTHNIMRCGSNTLYSLTGCGAKRRGLSPVIVSHL